MANREDVVTSSSRNLGLLEGIAEAFVKAIHEMYSHKTLRYQWMRYLAGIKEYAWDDFWRRLVDKITAKMAEAEILEPRRRGSPRRIGDLRRLHPMAQDSNGDPLFDDLPGLSEMYISTGYEKADQDILEDYGLIYLYQDEFMARVKHDLSLPNSRMRMKNPKTSKDWHTRAAKKINLAWDRNWAHLTAEAKALDLLPLSSGTWVSANTRDVYLPTLDSGIEIPSIFGLDILAARACKNPERLKLFRNLGARCADVRDVRAKTLKELGRSEHLSLSDEIPMLEFLYRTCSHQPGSFGQYDVVKICNSLWESHSPSQAECLFPSDDAFSPWQLSVRSQDEDIENITNFIHEYYLKDEPPKSGRLSWREWLEAAIGVRRFPSLVGTDGNSLSELCKYVAEETPECFLGFLRHAWESEKDSVLENPAVLEELKGIMVTCNAEGGPTYRLRDTYLPTLGLQQTASSLMEGEDFPFLWLCGETLSDDNLGTWTFLKRDLAVGSQDDAQFYIDIARHIKLAMAPRADIEDPERMIKVYGRIHTRINESTDRSSWEETLR